MPKYGHYYIACGINQNDFFFVNSFEQNWGNKIEQKHGSMNFLSKALFRAQSCHKNVPVRLGVSDNEFYQKKGAIK